MSFLPSKELIKTGTYIYVFGAGGMGVRLFALKLDKVPGVDLTIPSDLAANVSGIFGLVVFFHTVSFGVRALAEYSEARLETLRADHEAVTAALTLRQLDRGLPTDPAIRPLAMATKGAVDRFERLSRIIGNVAGVVQVVLPMLFGAISVAVLARSTVSFFVDVLRRIWAVFMA